MPCKYVEFDTDISLGVTITAAVTIGRPAPDCQDPSFPAYHDDGAPDEVGGMRVYMTRLNHANEIIKIDITKFLKEWDTEVLEELAIKEITDG